MKTETMYGFPLSNILFRMIGLILLCLCILFIILMFSWIYGLVASIVLILYAYGIIIRYKTRFLTLRNRILDEMIQFSDLNGDEKILDLGTGAGFVAIGFAKKLHTGQIYGIDKYHIINEGVFSQIFDEMKINFFGNTITNAEKNAQLERQDKKLTFLQGDLIEGIPFTDNEFDVIVCSQFLYCISKQYLENVLQEIDRVLRPSGTIVFFESKKFLQWNIQDVSKFFTTLDYSVDLYQVKDMTNKYYLVGKKP